MDQSKKEEGKRRRVGGYSFFWRITVGRSVGHAGARSPSLSALTTHFWYTAGHVMHSVLLKGTLRNEVLTGEGTRR